jgi:hypothetical protein
MVADVGLTAVGIEPRELTYYMPDATTVELTRLGGDIDRDPEWWLFYFLPSGTRVPRILDLENDLDHAVNRKDSAEVTAQVIERLSARYVLTDETPAGFALARWGLSPR